VTFEAWRDEFWRSPLIDQAASLVAFVGDDLAAMTMIRVDTQSGRAQNSATGTRRAFRGRGLARLLKTHSLHCAAGLGATIAITDNDETNAPMLAVNTKLGYRPFARRLEWERVMASD
jgi:GNAT superfamily N-acetyltransferase